MSEKEPLLDNQSISHQEFVAQSILPRFPQTSLSIRESKTDTIFEIHYQEKLLLVLDKKGTRYFFPCRRKRIVNWEKVTINTRQRVIENILRDLAEANYVVLSTTSKPVLKRPIHISRLTRCPECKQTGGIKLIVREERLAAENSEIYTMISPTIDLNGAEIKCVLCGWIGIREEISRKFRSSRSS